MTESDPLDGKTAAALALARGWSTDDAAQAAGVSTRTLRRWLQTDHEFAADVRRLRAELLNRALGQLTDAATEAVQTLKEALGCDSPQTRVRAAVAILANAIVVRDAVSVEERLAALEEAADQREAIA